MLLSLKKGELFIENSSEFTEIENLKIFFKGYFFYNNNFYREGNAPDLLNGHYKAEKLFGIIHKLNGIYVCILIDERKKKIIVFNDRTGLRQLFYTQTSVDNYFISDNVWCVCDKRNINDIDVTSYLELLSYRFVSSKYTLIKDVFQIRPATISEIDYSSSSRINNNTTEYFFYRNNPVITNKKDAEQAIFEASDKIIRKYIELAFVKDTIGINLTGGLDSRFIIALLLKNNYPLEKMRVFTFGTAICEDIRYSEKVATTIGIKHKKEIFDDSFIDFFRQETIDECLRKIGSTTYYFQAFAIIRLVKKYYDEIDFLLTGADGYILGTVYDDQIIGLKSKDELMNFLLKKNNTILNFEQLSMILKPGYKIDIIENLNQRLAEELNENRSDTISIYYDWIMKNRMRKYPVAIYDLLSEKTCALLNYYDYDFLDLMLSFSPELYKDQQPYINAIYNYAFQGKGKKLANIPVDKRGMFKKKGADYIPGKLKKHIACRAYNRIFSIPDKDFAYPIYKTWKVHRDEVRELINKSLNMGSSFLDIDQVKRLLEINSNKEYFFRYGLLSILSAINMEEILRSGRFKSFL